MTETADPTFYRAAARGGPLAGHTPQFVASLINQGAQNASIIHSDPFVIV